MSFLAGNLKILRKRKGIKQAEIQSAIGFRATTWSNYETGVSEPDLDGVITISKFFGVSIDSLLLVDLNSEGEDVQLNTKKGGVKKLQNVQLNVKPSVQLNSKNDHREEVERLKKMIADKDEIIRVQKGKIDGLLLAITQLQQGFGGNGEKKKRK